MLSIKEPYLRWGISGWQTAITGRLFTEELFTFKAGADTYIDKAKAFFASEGRPMADDEMFPVLIKFSASICSDEETNSYANKQAEWLEEHGQAAKRRRAANMHNVGVKAPVLRSP